MLKHRSGDVLNTRRNGPVLWQARIGAGRGRLEVVGVVAASTLAAEISQTKESITPTSGITFLK